MLDCKSTEGRGLRQKRADGEYMRRWCQIAAVVAEGKLAAGCPHDRRDYNSAQKAIDIQDFDAAVHYYLKALKADPHNANYKIGCSERRLDPFRSLPEDDVNLARQGC